MKNLPCEVVRDLLPSYVDGLISEATNGLLEQHLEDCAGCKSVLDSMRAPEERPVSEIDQKELDFLKKNKRRNWRIALGSILAALALLAGIFGTRLYLTGSEATGDWVFAKAAVDGQHLTIDCASADSLHAISAVRFREDDGVITASARAVLPSFLHRGDARREYDASQPIREVRLNDRIIWANGKSISSVTSNLYQTRHEYVGDMSANLESAAALGLSTRYGSFTNELDTESTPYVWHIQLQKDEYFFDGDNAPYVMQHLGYALLAVIGNLDEVRFEYTYVTEVSSDYQTPVSFRTDFVSVTREDASAYLGRDIKDCYDDVALLEELLTAANLTVSG